MCEPHGYTDNMECENDKTGSVMMQPSEAQNMEIFDFVMNDFVPNHDIYPVILRHKEEISITFHSFSRLPEKLCLSPIDKWKLCDL